MLSVSSHMIANITRMIVPLMMITPFDPSIEVKASRSIGSIAWKFHSAAAILVDADVGIVGSKTGAAVGMRVGLTAITEPLNTNTTIHAIRILTVVFKAKRCVISITPSVLRILPVGTELLRAMRQSKGRPER